MCQGPLRNPWLRQTSGRYRNIVRFFDTNLPGARSPGPVRRCYVSSFSFCFTQRAVVETSQSGQPGIRSGHSLQSTQQPARTD